MGTQGVQGNLVAMAGNLDQLQVFQVFVLRRHQAPHQGAWFRHAGAQKNRHAGTDAGEDFVHLDETGKPLGLRVGDHGASLGEVTAMKTSTATTSR